MDNVNSPEEKVSANDAKFRIFIFDTRLEDFCAMQN